MSTAELFPYDEQALPPPACLKLVTTVGNEEVASEATVADIDAAVQAAKRAKEDAEFVEHARAIALEINTGNRFGRKHWQSAGWGACRDVEVKIPHTE